MFGNAKKNHGSEKELSPLVRKRKGGAVVGGELWFADEKGRDRDAD